MNESLAIQRKIMPNGTEIIQKTMGKIREKTMRFDFVQLHICLYLFNILFSVFMYKKKSHLTIMLLIAIYMWPSINRFIHYDYFDFGFP